MTVQLAVARPLKVGPLTLPNRFVMGSMHTNLEGDLGRFGELARYYAERAKGGAALIITGGFSPNHVGRLDAEPGSFDAPEQVPAHRKVTDAVHAEGGRILLQFVHAGRYGHHSDIVAPSPIKSPINQEVPVELTEAAILETVGDYVRGAKLAQEAGYDGIEIMGSEGYLISQFLAPRTNHRSDRWGGSLENRARFPLSVVKAVRQAVGPGFLIDFRISVLDIVEGGIKPEETAWLGRALAAAGVDCFNTGIGWHEAPVPTIAAVVPHAAFQEAIARFKAAVPVPVIASNRINLPEVAERIVSSHVADLVSLARPFLADAAFARKVLAGRPDLVNICIACNQGCLDHYFNHKVITCLVNPRAVHEGEFAGVSTGPKKRVAVVGAGVAGIAAALEAAQRGHAVTLYDGLPEIGGQLRLASLIPGKSDYARALDGFKSQLVERGVIFRLGRPITKERLLDEAYDDIIVATGISPRRLEIPGADDPRVVDYISILNGTVTAGDNVVIIGGGGIGHDVALFLAYGGKAHGVDDVGAFMRRWGIGQAAVRESAARRITMVKRSPGGFGRTLGKTTGWIVRQELKDFAVRQIAGVTYLKIDKDGLHVSVEGQVQVLPADTIVVCAGQISKRSLADELTAAGQAVHVIGGARVAGELDAKRAIEEGARLGNSL